MLSPRLVTLSLLASTFIVRADQDLLPVNPDVLAAELNTLEAKEKQKKSLARSAIASQIQSAISSPQAAEAAYMAAVEAVQFRGRSDKVTAFLDWKKANAEKLRSRDVQASFIFTLKYMLLAIQRKGLDKPEKILPAANAYVSELLNNYPDDPYGILTKDISQNVFADYFGVTEWLPDNSTWESQPGDIPGQLEKNIRPILRDLKSPQILSTWDLQIKIASEAATKSKNTHKQEVFNAVTRQQLLYQRALDLNVLGYPNRAVSEIVTLIKSYPDHPDFPNWLAKVRELINRPVTPSGSAVPNGSPSSTTAPEAPPTASPSAGTRSINPPSNGAPAQTSPQ